MIPTRQQVLDATRARLGDTEQPGGGRWTDDKLEPHLQTAYQILIQRLAFSANRKARREYYWVLPANTSYLDPATIGITNMGEPLDIWDRKHVSATEITGVALNSTASPPNAALTAVAHGLQTGQRAIVYGPLVGISDDIHDEWTVTVQDANTVLLNGSTATGAWTSGGFIAGAPEPWSEFPLVPDYLLTSQPVQTSQATLGRWMWQNDILRFPAATTARQLKLSIALSGTVPPNPQDMIGVDDSLNFLSTYTAGMALSALGTSSSAAAALFLLAVGNQSGDTADAAGGFLGVLVRQGVRSLQHGKFVTPRFRPKRNTGGVPWRW